MRFCNRLTFFKTEKRHVCKIFVAHCNLKNGCIQSFASTDRDSKHQDSSLPPSAFSRSGLWFCLYLVWVNAHTHTLLWMELKTRVFECEFG